MSFPEDLDDFFRYGLPITQTDNQIVPDNSMSLQKQRIAHPESHIRREDQHQAQMKTENTFTINTSTLKTFRKTYFPKKQKGAQCKIDKERQFEIKVEPISTVEPTMYPETPMRNKFSRFHESGSEFQVVRPQIVPETPSQIIINGTRRGNVYHVPETPLMDVFKTPRMVEH